MRRNRILAVVGCLLCLSFCLLEAKAQSDEVAKYEVGIHFSSITKSGYGTGRTEVGVGSRFTFNLSRSVAIEAEGNLFPGKCGFCGVSGDNNGNISEGLFRIKAGKRFQKWGIFAKGGPGLVSFSQGDFRYVAGSNGTFNLSHDRLTHFAADLGAVVEFYPSKHIVTRFDAGDIMIHYAQRNSSYVLFTTPTGPGLLIPTIIGSSTRHNFQFSAGVGYRF